jgi:hypothetical protein
MSGRLNKGWSFSGSCSINSPFCTSLYTLRGYQTESREGERTELNRKRLHPGGKDRPDPIDCDCFRYSQRLIRNIMSSFWVMGRFKRTPLPSFGLIVASAAPGVGLERARFPAELFRWLKYLRK